MLDLTLRNPTSQPWSKQMPELILTSAQRQALKGARTRLRPVVLLGAAGLTDKVLREIDRALAAHALIKIKVPSDDRSERTQVAADVAEKLSAANVQSIGKMIVLFRPQPESEEKQEPDAPMNQRTDERRQRSKNRRVISRLITHFERSVALKTRYTKPRRSNIRARRQALSPLQCRLRSCRSTRVRSGSIPKSSRL